MRNRTARIVCRAVVLAAALVTVATSSYAQPNPLPLAARIDYFSFLDCESGCYVEVSEALVTPSFSIAGGSQPTWSPGGMQLAFTSGLDTWTGATIFVVPATGGTPVGLTGGLAPAWSPDGAQIAFVRLNAGTTEVGVMNADGSGVRILSQSTFLTVSSDYATVTDHPAWSPDSSRIAFTCQIDSGNVDICVVNRDGTGLVRLTNDRAADWSPVWSPDGTKLAFSTERFGGGMVLASMNDDGSGVSQIGTALIGWPGSWSADGRQIAVTTLGDERQVCHWSGAGGGTVCVSYHPFVLYSTSPDGTVVTPMGEGEEPAWAPRNLPLAALTFTCNGSTCHFDASGSTDAGGAITSYAWDFGDGTSGTGVTQTHAYASHGVFTVALAATDDTGAIGRKFQEVIINSPPVASFTSTCDALTCTFNASGSSDSDGTIVSYTWSFGDGAAGTGVTVTHAYSAAGTYTMSLLVTDNNGGTGSRAMTVTAVPPTMHVGDLDRVSTSQGNTWTATVTITVHDSSHSAVANAVVGGSWSNGSLASCTTNALGRCSVLMPGIAKKTSSLHFSVTNAALATFVYKPADNHDPDGESDGTTITIPR